MSTTYTVVVNSKGESKIHRDTCKRLGKGDVFGIDSDSDKFPEAVEGATLATCCKPSRERITAEAKNATSERAAADGSIVAARAQAQADARNARERDMDPNIVETVEENGIHVVPTATKGRKQIDSPRYREACAIQAKGKRGKGVKISDEDLVRYCQRIQAEHGAEGLSVRQETHIAYWVMKFATSDSRFATAWATAREAKAA